MYKKFNSAVFPGYQGGPLMHVIAAKAAAFHEALQPDFRDIYKISFKMLKFYQKHSKTMGLRFFQVEQIPI